MRIGESLAESMVEGGSKGGGRGLVDLSAAESLPTSTFSPFPSFISQPSEHQPTNLFPSSYHTSTCLLFPLSPTTSSQKSSPSSLLLLPSPWVRPLSPSSPRDGLLAASNSLPIPRHRYDPVPLAFDLSQPRTSLLDHREGEGSSLLLVSSLSRRVSLLPNTDSTRPLFFLSQVELTLSLT